MTEKETGPVKEAQRVVRGGRVARIVQVQTPMEGKLIHIAKRLSRITSAQKHWVCWSLETTDGAAQVECHQEN